MARWRISCVLASTSGIRSHVSHPSSSKTTTPTSSRSCAPMAEIPHMCLPRRRTSPPSTRSSSRNTVLLLRDTSTMHTIRVPLTPFCNETVYSSETQKIEFRDPSFFPEKNPLSQWFHTPAERSLETLPSCFESSFLGQCIFVVARIFIVSFHSIWNKFAAVQIVHKSQVV